MFCYSCGTENEDGNRFCRSCGTALQSVATAPAPTPVSVAAENVPAVEAAPPKPISTPDAGKVCPLCKTEFPPELKFCDRDGAALLTLEGVADEPGAAIDDAPAAMAPATTPPALTGSLTQFCENCGSQLASDDTFCSDCGTKVEPLEELATPSATPPALPEPAPRPELDPKPLAAVPAPDEPDTVPVAIGGEPGVLEQGEPVAEDTETLPWALAQKLEESADAVSDEPVDFEEGEQVEAAPWARSLLVWSASVLALIGIVGGAGYVWRDQLAAITGDGSAGGGTAGLDAQHDGIPRVSGKYAAFLMDQEIEISFEGDPAVLSQAKGTARYLNKVNGGRCVSRLVAVKSGGIGGDTSGKVLFSQQPKDGEPACGQDIPMLIDIEKQTMSEGGLVSHLSVEWQSPKTNEVLMSGVLVLSKSAG